MRRVSPIVWAALAGFLTLLILPSTRWAVLNHLDLLRGQFFYRGMGAYPAGNALEVVIVPQRSYEPDRWRTHNQKGELGRAIAMAYIKRDVGLLQAYRVKHPNDPIARSILATNTQWMSPALIRPNPNTKVTSDLKQRVKKGAKQLLSALEGIDRIEPDNAFFPMLRSFALVALDRDREALDQYHLAASKPGYDIYAMEACEAQWYAYEQSDGYRGQAVRLNALGGYLLPQDAVMKVMAQWVIEREGMPGRIATARLARTVALKSNIHIDVFVARSMLLLSILGPHTNVVNPEKWSQSEVQAKAAELDRQVEGTDFRFSSVVKDLAPLLGRNIPFGFNDSSDPTWYLRVPRSLVAAAALLLAIIAFPAVALLRRLNLLNAKPDRCPHLVWILIAAVPNEQKGMAVWPLACIGWILLIAAWSVPARFHKAVRIAGYVLAAACLFFAGIDWPYGSLVAGLYVAADLSSRWEPKRRFTQSMIALAAIAAMIGITIFTVWDVARTGFYPAGWLFCYLCIGVALLPRMRVWPRWLAPGLMTLGCVAYLGCVAWEIHDDRAMAEIVRIWTHEADMFRHQIGLS